MKALLVLAILAFLGFSHTKSIEPVFEPVETKWMDRVYDGPSSMITNGDPADISEFPWMLALIDLRLGGFRCGASAISSRWSLTAARK